MAVSRTAPLAPLDAKYLCAELLNTEYMYRNLPVERLPTADRIADWLVERGLFTNPEDRAQLREWAVRRPDEIVARFHALRRDMRQLVAAVRARETLPAAELARVQSLLAEGCRTSRLVQAADAWHLESRLRLEEPAQLAVPVAESFAELLVSGEAERLKECASTKCTILFYDSTKNQRRAWCTPCASRAKALRYYHKNKSDTPADAP